MIIQQGLVLDISPSRKEARGNIIRDKSRKRNDGTIYGAKWGFSPLIGNYFDFDGVDDYISSDNVGVNTAAGAKNTVELWMYWRGVECEMPFGWNTGYDLYLANNSFGFNTAEGNIEGFSGTDFLKNSWHHVAAIFYNGVPSSPNVELWIDGIKKDVIHLFGDGPSSRTVTPKIVISGWGASDSYKFDGYIDEVRIYNRALNEAEIKNNMYSSDIYQMLRGIKCGEI